MPLESSQTVKYMYSKRVILYMKYYLHCKLDIGSFKVRTPLGESPLNSPHYHSTVAYLQSHIPVHSVHGILTNYVYSIGKEETANLGDPFYVGLRELDVVRVSQFLCT